MSFNKPGFFEKMRTEWLWNRMGSFRYKKYIHRLQLRSDENVLDFGCGGGAVSKCIANELSNGSLVCLDTSAFWLEKAKNRMNFFSNVEYICASIEDAGLIDNHFDSVFIHFVLHDIAEKYRQEVIDALACKLKEEGRIFIREPTRQDHGMLSSEIEQHMDNAGLSKMSGVHGSYFLWPHYTGVFRK